MKTKSTYEKRQRSFKLKLIGLIALIAIIGVGVEAAMSFNDHSYTITVTDKERVYNKNSKSSKYLVWGTDVSGDSLVFENEDSMIRFKFNSSNIQGKLIEGGTYEITVIGYRVPFLSMYENIIDVEEVEVDSTTKDEVEE